MGSCYSTQDIVENNIQNNLENKKDKWHEINNINDMHNIPLTTFENKICVGKVCRVLDGDTVEIIIKLEKIEKYQLRLYGINAPEIHTKNEEERVAGLFSKVQLEKILDKDNNLVTIFFTKDDKYGRRMGIIKTKSGIDCNKWMLENNLAQEYFGEKKLDFNDWKLKHKLYK